MEHDNHRSVPPLVGVCTLTSQCITSSTVTLIVVLVTYPLQDRHTFLALLQTSPNLMSQYSVMEDELFELREREGGMVKEGERRGLLFYSFMLVFLPLFF